MSTRETFLKAALAAFGVTFMLVYPLAIIWPSGWAWHQGAPYESQYFMMIVGVYATLGAFLLNAARAPREHVSLIWFTVISSVVHALVMTVQSVQMEEHAGHLVGDVPALLIAAAVLAALAPAGRRNGSANG